MAIQNKSGQQSKSLVWRNWWAAALESDLCVFRMSSRKTCKMRVIWTKATNARVCSCTLAWPGNIAKKKKNVTCCKILIICGRVYGRGHVFPILDLQVLPISACVRDRWGYLFEFPWLELFVFSVNNYLENSGIKNCILKSLFPL